MAEQDDNWFGSWLSAAKDKVSAVGEIGLILKNRRFLEF
jgi:hypothetical protein